MIFENRSKWYPTDKALPLFEWAESFVFGPAKKVGGVPDLGIVVKEALRVPVYRAYLMDYPRSPGIAGRGTAWSLPLHLIVRLNQQARYPHIWNHPKRYGHFRVVLHNAEEVIVSVAIHEMTHILHYTQGGVRLPEDLLTHLLQVDPRGSQRMKAMAAAEVSSSGEFGHPIRSDAFPTYRDLRRAKLEELDTTRRERDGVAAWIKEHQPEREALVSSYGKVESPTDQIHLLSPWMSETRLRVIQGRMVPFYPTSTKNKYTRVWDEPQEGFMRTAKWLHVWRLDFYIERWQKEQMKTLLLQQLRQVAEDGTIRS